MPIELEKVLEEPLEDYLKREGKSKDDYTIKLLSYAIHSNSPSISGDKSYRSPTAKVDAMVKIAEQAPDESEIVVGFNISTYGTGDMEAYAKALIPKED